MIAFKGWDASDRELVVKVADSVKNKRRIGRVGRRGLWRAEQFVRATLATNQNLPYCRYIHLFSKINSAFVIPYHA